MTKNITLRPVTESDEEFLLAVYASTRAEEMERVPWTAEQKDTFVKMQFAAQKSHYAASYPEANHDLIYVDGEAVGRIYLDRGPDGLHILDVTVLLEYRNRGIGSAVLGRLLEEAGAGGKALTIYVETFNPSLRLFERLGFRHADQKDFQLLLKWQALP